jgi:hypothetical protein
VRCESDERSSSLTRGAGESHRLGTLGLDTSDHDERESSALEELLRPTESVLSTPWANEDRAFFPERTSDGAESIDPDRSFALSDGGVTGCSQNSGGSALWHPDSESTARQTMSGENRIESIDAGCHRLGGPMGDRSCIGKSMLDERAYGGISIRHYLARVARTYPESKKKTRDPV